MAKTTKIRKAVKPVPFVETEAIFIEAPEYFHDVSGAGWVPFLPKPGKYEHPKFGDVVIDNARNSRMVESVKGQVYQERIPLDLEHDLKVSGAVGWISDMRMNVDGSADAFVEWTDRGQEVLKGNRFRYISPEWFRQWKDPATGKEHLDVVAGGALTTRPFFKDKVLRALVASERGVEIVGREQFAGENGDAEESEDVEEEDEVEESESEAEEEEEASDDVEDSDEEEEEEEDDIEAEEEEEFSEMTETFTEGQASAIEAYVEQEIQRATQSFTEQLAAETARGDRAETALRVLETERRTDRFTEVVRNRDAGAPFVGGLDKQVKILLTLAESFGEESEEFTDYVETQKAAAEQVKTSQAFSELGSSASGASNSEPVRRIEAMAEEVRKTKPALTKEQAFSEAINTPDGARLYAESLNR
jgi:hypothetical protein